MSDNELLKKITKKKIDEVANGDEELGAAITKMVNGITACLREFHEECNLDLFAGAVTLVRRSDSQFDLVLHQPQSDATIAELRASAELSSLIDRDKVIGSRIIDLGGVLKHDEEQSS